MNLTWGPRTTGDDIRLLGSVERNDDALDDAGTPYVYEVSRANEDAPDLLKHGRAK
ncbi:hypothetical protein [Paratractidigestivibacter sp.]|uniref:hypothetical protein n=1 Tax=Paratractidigestivibacter sp. TaxID=2847316 RepID=UPI002ACB1233|nr:hypothetical protein [Paratractidigestivibacter sp.]